MGFWSSASLGLGPSASLLVGPPRSCLPLVVAARPTGLELATAELEVVPAAERWRHKRKVEEDE
jgi:hypothetical protein